MSYFSQVTKVVPIDTDDLATAKNKVTIRRLDYSQRQACISLATTITTHATVRAKGSRNKAATAAANTADREAEVIVDGALMAAEQLKASVVSWEGPDFDGRPATPENVGQLPPWIADKLSEAVDALNNGLDEEEKKD